MNNTKVKFFHSNTNKIEIVYTKDSSTQYPMHNHISNYVVGFIVSGKIRLISGNNQTIINKNDFFIIPPYKPHAIETVCGAYTMVTMCISTEFVSSYNIENALPFLYKLLDSLLLKGLIESNHLPIISRAIKFLLSNTATTKEQQYDEIIAAKGYLEQSSENAISIEQLSQSVYLSKYHFIREFRKNVGLTPHRFQIQNRIRKAQRLLLGSSDITEIALSTGFYDQSHFIKCFKKILGITPTDYIMALSELPQ